MAKGKMAQEAVPIVLLFSSNPSARCCMRMQLGVNCEFIIGLPAWSAAAAACGMRHAGGQCKDGNDCGGRAVRGGSFEPGTGGH